LSYTPLSVYVAWSQIVFINDKHAGPRQYERSQAAGASTAGSGPVPRFSTGTDGPQERALEDEYATA